MSVSYETLVLLFYILLSDIVLDVAEACGPSATTQQGSSWSPGQAAVWIPGKVMAHSYQKKKITSD